MGKNILEHLNYQIFLNSYFRFFSGQQRHGSNENLGFRTGLRSLNEYSKSKMLYGVRVRKQK